MSKKLPEEFESQMKEMLQDSFPAFQSTVLAGDSPVSIRLNSGKKYDFDLGTNDQVAWNSDGYYLSERPVFTLDPAFHAGAYYVQEASSMFIKEALIQHIDFQMPLKVLDLCAAPGGKTTLIADLLNEDSLLVANEVIKSRVGGLKENLQKWGFVNYLVTNHDSEEFADLEGFFDLVLVDAPCSGEGLFRKDEDASSHWSPDAVQMCSARQKRILQAAAYLVAPNGHLVYSTCTYNNKENIENVDWLINNHDFEYKSLKILPEWGIVDKKVGYQFYPHKLRGEGFFVSVLQKTFTSEDFPQAKIKLNKLPTKQKETLRAWITDFENFEYYLKPDNGIIAIPLSLISEYGTVLKALFKRSSGFEIGEFKGNDFIPSHALALSQNVHPNLPKLELDKENALLFFKRENFEVKTENNGWYLITYQNLGLGWVKVIGDRINNYLPKEWRIRMDLPDLI